MDWLAVGSWSLHVEYLGIRMRLAHGVGSIGGLTLQTDRTAGRLLYTPTISLHSQPASQ